MNWVLIICLLLVVILLIWFFKRRSTAAPIGVQTGPGGPRPTTLSKPNSNDTLTWVGVNQGGPFSAGPTMQWLSSIKVLINRYFPGGIVKTDGPVVSITVPIGGYPNFRSALTSLGSAFEKAWAPNPRAIQFSEFSVISSSLGDVTAAYLGKNY